MLSDNEIIKGLEYLTYGGNFCLRCEHKIITGDNRCGIDGCNIAKKALDLINRQQAEIERLSNTVKTDFLTVTEKLKLSQSEIGDIRAEAIKEFAELVKLEFYREFDELIPSIMADRIDTLAEEMTVNNESSKQRKEDENGKATM